MTDPTATQPWTVTLAWSPDQNFGRVSTLNGRAPVFAVVGLVRAGESPDRIADEYGLTVEQVTVIGRLAGEGWAS